MTRYEGVPIHVDFVDDAKLRMITMLAPPPVECLQPMPAKACLTSGATVEQCRGATLKKARTPLGQTLNRKTASKHSCVDSALESVSSDQSLAKLAKSSNKIRLAQIEMKHQKMQFASDEWTLALQKQMQDRDLQLVLPQSWSQLGVAWVELPEFEVNSNSGEKSCNRVNYGCYHIWFAITVFGCEPH